MTNLSERQLKKRETDMSVTTLVPWYGSARLLAQRVGEQLRGCNWVGIPFAGGLCEVLELSARTIVVNDLHRHLINLSEYISDPGRCGSLRRELEATLFHPDALAAAQQVCRHFESTEPTSQVQRREWASAYFCCCWMTRSGSAGTSSEFTGKLCLRWESGGGDSNVRFRSAVESLELFQQAMCERCTFSMLDAFAFLDMCKDRAGHGIYCDPPFLTAGLKYTHSPAKGTEEEWHRSLQHRLTQFQHARIVVRAYEHPLVREMYQPADGWSFVELVGRKQTNAAAPELLMVRN